MAMKKLSLSVLLCILTLTLFFQVSVFALEDDTANTTEELVQDLQLIDYSTFTMDESKISLAHNCNTNYGYRDLVNHVGNTTMVNLYEKIDEIYEAFFASSADAVQDGDALAGAIAIEESLLTEDQIFQTWTVYRMDHPVYYWVPESPALTISDSTITINLGVYSDYALGTKRQAMYTRLRSRISQFSSYASGSNSRYTYATASLYKLAQIANYAYGASGDAETSPWAHSIAGLIDGTHSTLVCEGYAKFYQLLMNYFGVPNVYVVGRANGNTGDSGSLVHHAWNLVQMDDGKWYGTDPTWADRRITFPKPSEMIDPYIATEIETNITSFEDCPFYVQYTYHLIGDSFYSNHWPLTTENTGLAYQYALPSTASADYTLPSSIGEAPAKGNLLDAYGESYVNDYDGDLCFLVLQNDGIHRAVELNRYGSGENLIIPAQITYEGISYDVVSVDLSCVNYNTKTATISEGVHYLTKSLCYESQVTESISIPSTVEWISYPTLSFVCLKNIFVSENNPYIKDVDGVLYNKSGTVLIRYPLAAEHKSYTVPSSVKQIYTSAFYNDRDLEKLDLPEGLTTIDPYAFRGMKSLKKLDIPSTVTSLPRLVMMDSYIEEIHITANTSFNFETFTGALGLEKIDVDEGNPCLIVYDGAMYLETDDGLELITYPSAREADSVTVHEDCKYIWPNAFSYAKHIGKVIIPENCELSECAFFRSSVEKLEVIGDNTRFQYIDGAILSSDGTELWTYLAGCRNKEFRVPDSVTLITASAFCYNPYIEFVYMGDQVQDIRVAAFYGCTALRNVRLSNSITWESAATNWPPPGWGSIFEGCCSLDHLEIPLSAKVIPGNMCWGCTNLRYLVIPSSVSIILDAFEADPSLPLSDIYYYGTEEQWNAISGIECFYRSYNNIVIHYNYDGGDIYTYDDFSWTLTEDGTLILYGNGPMKPFPEDEIPWLNQKENIKKVIVADGVTSICANAFARCNNLTQVVLPDGITRIGIAAFTECKSLKEISLPDSLNYIGVNAFNGAGLTTINLGPSLNIIDLYDWDDGEPFYGCWSLEGITVDPENTEYAAVDGVLFNKMMTKLLCYPAQKANSSYRVPDSVVQLNDDCFSNCTNLRNVILPNSLCKIGFSIFYLCNMLETVYYTGTQEEWDQINIGNNNEILLDKLIIGEHEHQEELQNVVEPGCEDDGYTGDIVCPICGMVLQSGEVIPNLGGHDWEEPEYIWTEGHLLLTATHYCKVNLEHVESEQVDVLAEITPPNETSEGLAVYTSAEFENESFVSQTVTVTIPALNSMKLLRLPNSLHVIEDEAFTESSCEAVLIPNGCISVGDRAFANCIYLRYVLIPQSVTTIGEEAFSNCMLVVIDNR